MSKNHLAVSKAVFRSSHMGNKKITDISHSFTQACSTENRRVPATLRDCVAQICMWLCLVPLRLILWVWQHMVLRLRRPRPNIAPKHILVYLQGMLGDVAVHLPAVKALRDRFPAARITCVCYSEGFPIAGLLEGLPYIDKLIVLDKHPVIRQGTELVYSCPELQPLSADLFVNFSPFSNRGVPGFLAREMAFAKKCDARFYLGDTLALYGVPAWARRAKRFYVRNEPRRSWRVLAPLHIEPMKNTAIFLPPRSSLPDVSRIYPHLVLLQGYAIIHPGAKRAVQLWPAEHYGKIASHLYHHHGLQVMVTGSQGESAIADRVVKESGGLACNVCGMSTLPEMIELIRHARIVITNDTGPMHISALLNQATVAIFGTRMTIKHWYPVGEHTTVVTHYHEDSFSYDDDGHVPHRMENILPEVVAGQIDDLLCES